MPTTFQENRDSGTIKKLRKHLNAKALFKTIYHRFEKIPDFRADDKIDIVKSFINHTKSSIHF